MKMINRNNYEEYFLLYADNELDAVTKVAVEDFVQQNADLAPELKMLLQTKSLPDELEFAHKEILIRTEGNSINAANHEEFFLLYIDNELSAAKREEVEMYVLQHPKLQDEFTTLKQAVLLPETTSYEDKKDLYRTEKRRTVYLKPWRFAAAAVFIGLCAVGLWLMQEPQVKIDVAANPSNQNQIKQKTITIKPADTTPQQVKQQQTIAKQSSPKKGTEVVAATEKKKENSINKKIIKEQLEQFLIQQPETTHNIAEEQKQTSPETNDDIAFESQHNNQKQDDDAALQTPLSNNNNNGYTIYPVAYKELNTNDDDNSLHVGMLDLNKTKVKNFFKKASRMFNNKQNNSANEDGKLQIANFEIETNKQ